MISAALNGIICRTGNLGAIRRALAKNAALLLWVSPCGRYVMYVALGSETTQASVIYCMMAVAECYNREVFLTTAFKAVRCSDHTINSALPTLVVDQDNAPSVSEYQVSGAPPAGSIIQGISGTLFTAVPYWYNDVRAGDICLVDTERSLSADSPCMNIGGVMVTPSALSQEASHHTSVVGVSQCGKYAEMLIPYNKSINGITSSVAVHVTNITGVRIVHISGVYTLVPDRARQCMHQSGLLVNGQGSIRVEHIDDVSTQAPGRAYVRVHDVHTVVPRGSTIIVQFK